MHSIITSLKEYSDNFPEDKIKSVAIIDWINRYQEFAFVKENLKGHITASLWIMNESKDKLLLMFHKKYQMWCQFGGHCDGEVDVRNVAIREFHEESGINIEPEIIGDILSLAIWNIPERTSSSGMFQPEHQHFDILYLGIIPEDTPFSRQESEVDDIRWFDIEGIEKYIGEKRMLDMIERIKIISHV